MQQEPSQPPRYAGGAYDRLTKRLKLPSEDWMQDWPYEVSDSSRLEEFCNVYEDPSLDDVERHDLMHLIVQSLDECLDCVDPVFLCGESYRRTETFLRRDFTLHFWMVEYWRCAEDEEHPDPELPNNHFNVSPMMRRVWHDCLRPEHQRWLDDENKRFTKSFEQNA